MTGDSIEFHKVNTSEERCKYEGARQFCSRKNKQDEIPQGAGVGHRLLDRPVGDPHISVHQWFRAAIWDWSTMWACRNCLEEAAEDGPLLSVCSGMRGAVKAQSLTRCDED